LKRHFPMMWLLVLDVGDDRFELRNADAERTVFFLPCKQSLVGKIFVNPFRGTAFDELHGFGNRHRGGSREKNMHMVGNAADFQSAHSILPRDAAEEWPKTFSQWRGDERAAFFGAQHAMVIRTHIGHGGISAVPSGLVTLEFANPALKRRASIEMSLRDNAREKTFRRRPAVARCPNH